MITKLKYLGTYSAPCQCESCVYPREAYLQNGDMGIEMVSGNNHLALTG